MSRQIVHDHDIAGSKRRREHLFDIGQKAFAIHRPVQNQRCRQTVEAQARREGRRLPMTVRHACPAALAARTAAAQPRHLCVYTCLINEDEPFWLQLQLVLEPGFATSQDIGALLLGSMRRLFLTVMS